MYIAKIQNICASFVQRRKYLKKKNQNTGKCEKKM
jgi:hypothetical protein